MSAEKTPESSGPSLAEPRKRNRGTHRRREPQDSAATNDIIHTTSVPSTSTPRNNGQMNENSHKEYKEATANSSNIVTNGSTTFEEGEDFIPFVISDSSDDEPGPSRRKNRTNGRHRETEKNSDRDATDGRQLSERQAMSNSNWNASDRVKGNSKMPESEQQGDRGKEAAPDDKKNGHERDRKRKYDGYDDGYSNQKRRVEVASRKCPWVAGLELNRCSNVPEMLHREVESFVDWISPSPVEDEVRGLIVTQVTQVISATFPDAQVFPFGSYQTKLYLPMGDIDLVVLSQSMAYSDKSTVLHALANALKRNKITSHVTIVAKARVPIVKFVTTHGRLKVDVSINQESGPFSGQIISGFLKDMAPGVNGGESKALRSLVMVTKAFLSQRGMNEVYTGGLGSYSVVCLAISFLQMHPKIRKGEIDPELNLGVLVIEFFELYGLHFNYDEVGISLRDGGTYFNKRQRGWHAEYKRNMLCIEDPADASNDISSGSYNFHKVRTAFAGAYGILTSTAYLRAGILSSRQQGRAIHLRSHDEPEDLSILSTVMGITQETINHRKLVQEIYDQRVLHSILGVQALPAVVKHVQTDEKNGYKPSSPSSKRKVVEDAWEETRQSRDYAYEESSRPRRLADEEDGRYHIGRYPPPPKKRRKTGRRKIDDHPVIFVDDDDEVEERSRGYDNGAGGGEYESYEGDGVDRYPSYYEKPRNDKARSYWLSKGIGPRSVYDDDDLSY